MLEQKHLDVLLTRAPPLLARGNDLLHKRLSQGSKSHKFRKGSRL